MDLFEHIRDIPDFPKPGILFRDISPLLAHHGAWKEAIRRLAEIIAPMRPDLLAGIESRGFLVAAPLALELGCGFVMVRKRGKLPGQTVSHEYDLEYGSDAIEIESGLIEPGQRVVLLDDLLATGGTAAAATTLIKKVGGEVPGAAFIIELSGLAGREKLDTAVHSLLNY